MCLEEQRLQLVAWLCHVPKVWELSWIGLIDGPLEVGHGRLAPWRLVGQVGPAAWQAQVGPLEVGAGQVGLLQLGPARGWPPGGWPMEVGSLEVGAGQVGLLEVGAVEVGPL